MNKIEKILLSIFFIYILLLSIFWIVKIYEMKHIKINTEIKVINKYDKIYIPYENNTIKNIKELTTNLIDLLSKTKEEIIINNKKLTYSSKLKADYFDFYKKYKKNIAFIKYLKEKHIYLEWFELKYFLNRLNSSEKLLNAISLNKENFLITWTKLNGYNVIYNKDKKNIRIQKKEDNKWKNIYVGKLDFFNIYNEYIYKIDFISYKDNPKRIYWIVHTLKKDMHFKIHFFDINLDNNYKIRSVYNIDNANSFIDIYNSNVCDNRLKYIYVSKETKGLEFACYDIYKKINITKPIIINN